MELKDEDKQNGQEKQKSKHNIVGSIFFTVFLIILILVSLFFLVAYCAFGGDNCV